MKVCKILYYARQQVRLPAKHGKPPNAAMDRGGVREPKHGKLIVVTYSLVIFQMSHKYSHAFVFYSFGGSHNRTRCLYTLKTSAVKNLHTVEELTPKISAFTLRIRVSRYIVGKNMALPKIHVLRLAHTHYQHPDLENAERFLLDFGLMEVERHGSAIYYRGFGEQPYIYVAEPSPDGKRHFMGATWVVQSEADLVRATQIGLTSILPHNGPGGGKMVTVKDPNGFDISFIYGQTLRIPDAEQHIDLRLSHDLDLVTNTAYEKARKGKFQRFRPGPSKVHKLGHYGLVVPKNRYEETVAWYTTFINLKPTDAVFDPRTGKDETCFFHMDHGAQYTDHHVSIAPVLMCLW
jgi:hypothetical protein